MRRFASNALAAFAAILITLLGMQQVVSVPGAPAAMAQPLA